ncbi:MAG: nucleotidyltransferase domain-containing protein [Candidatus Shapirobacteria bacterium]|nr:nucleotidyltransferase domain-containing protein [Candidatus Shapirobacteria bacterium]
MELETAIKNTIEYAKKFKSWVNRKEIAERLVSPKEFSEEEINGLLKRFINKNKKNKYFNEKFYKAAGLAKTIETNFGDILFLGLSGSVASGHPKKSDDIDFLIVTKGNRLWKTRLGLRWWMFKNRIPHRKYRGKEKKDEFCFNLWLDENHLWLPTDKQNLKNSVDLVLLKPLINKNQTYEKFFLVNNWAKKWVATPYFNKVKDVRYKILDKKIKQNNFDKVINCLYFWPQYWYMKRKISKETVGLYQAFFHRQMVK